MTTRSTPRVLAAALATQAFGYAAGIDPNSPLLAPIRSPGALARFPPAMVLTGTRSFDQSGAVLTHRALLAAGATAELHVGRHVALLPLQPPDARGPRRLPDDRRLL